LRSTIYRAVFALGLVITASGAFAQFAEIEDNNTKAQALANGVFTVNFGQWLTGTTTGSSTATGLGSLDMFLVRGASAMAPGIYKNRLTLTSSTPGHTATLRGLNQSAGVIGATDSTLQSVTTGNYNQWYSFGGATQGQIYYQVAGTTATTAAYTATMSVEQILPQNLGNFVAGNLTITSVGQGHTTDTDLWVYDSNFNAIPTYGNDDTLSPASLTSTLTRNYAPGTYYLAISNFQLANNQASAADDGFRSGLVTDFAGVVVNNSNAAGMNLSFAVTDANGTAQYSSIKQGAFDVNWYKFQVVGAVPEPGSMIALGVGIAALVARRRRK
jgi:hypothetical protein